MGLSPGRHSSTEREQDKTQSTATRRKPPDDSGAGSFGINLDDVLDDDIRAGLPVIICARWVLVISGLSLTHDPSFSQGLPLWLLLWNLQPLSSPYAFNTLVVHLPATIPGQCGDPAVAVAAIPSCQVGDVSRQEFMVVRDPRSQTLCCSWLCKHPAGFTFMNIQYLPNVINTCLRRRAGPGSFPRPLLPGSTCRE